ncbi:glycosyltransferase 87 family protein [Nocardia vaccinii]|uniref:glycosyltransferase 87 family protein n=1 Tax=Nocardia vaccinii TaxID=1822 RepID=UPI0009FE22BF|nr:glycosyltransferase 87 family protein [Nocardia vaccinii]
MVSVTASVRQPPATRRMRRVAWLAPPTLLTVSVLWLVFPSWPMKPISRAFIDLQVYRLGVQAAMHGVDMYGSLPKTTLDISLPFIYPPFAAIALGPFALLPWNAAQLSFFVVSTLAMAVTIYLAARRLWGYGGTELVLWATACAAPLGMLLEPIHSTLDFGQVNLILMVLVAADCLTERPKWKRGIGVGLAAAIKLTPAAFVLYFLIRRDYKAAITAAITGAAASALAFALMPRESMRYWFGGMGNVSGLSGSAFHTNQSIQGVLARLRVPEPAFTCLWLVLSLVLLVLVVAAMRRAVDNPPLAMSFNAVFTLLVSPISWSHHWVWIAPALLAAVGAATRLPLRTALVWYAVTLGTAAIFVIGPQNQLPGDDNREFAWTAWQHVYGDTYVWLSVALVAWYVLVTPRNPEPFLPTSVRNLRSRVSPGA